MNASMNAREHFEEAVARVVDLAAKVQFLVDYMNSEGLLEEGCFTFPDGETWWATNSTQFMQQGDSVRWWATGALCTWRVGPTVDGTVAGQRCGRFAVNNGRCERHTFQ